MMVLKNRIKECRIKEKIKQVQLAEMIGVSRETVGRLETGKYQNPTLRLAHDVATCLGKNIDDVFYYEEDGKEKSCPEM